MSSLYTPAKIRKLLAGYPDLAEGIYPEMHEDDDYQAEERYGLRGAAGYGSREPGRFIGVRGDLYTAAQRLDPEAREIVGLYSRAISRHNVDEVARLLGKRAVTVRAAFKLALIQMATSLGWVPPAG